LRRGPGSAMASANSASARCGRGVEFPLLTRPPSIVDGASPLCFRSAVNPARLPSYRPGAENPLVVGASATRKTVTVVFADVVGSTVLGDGLDPESLRS